MALFEETNPCDIDINELISTLKKHYTVVEKKDLRFFYHGTYNVFEFKDFILRVPDVTFRNQKGIQLIQEEAMKLKNLSSFLNIPIPQPTKISLDEEMPFMVYTKLSGVPLSTVFSDLTHQQYKQIAIEIAEFLNQLHSPTLFHQVNAKIFNTSFQTEDYKQYWRNKFEEFKEKVFPMLNLLQKFWSQQIFETFLENPRNFQFTPVLTHGDFDMSNILVDPKKSKITGIVDFEQCCVWDPAADLLFYEQPIFQDTIISAYAYSDSVSLFERMKFLYCRTWLEYVLFGLQHHKQNMVKYGLMRLEKLRRKFPCFS
ncbi:MAG: aminoglycoside phosphotransferase family protein [Candidatus Lokiarchaeota archaeon]|nr:aminoglycoside phosphotransferase family protein [Candidatus Lokiarchaeota archaeon]